MNIISVASPHVRREIFYQGMYDHPCTSMYQSVFLGHLHAFLRHPYVFSHAFGCGARRGAACTPRRWFRSRAGSVERALGDQSREILQKITGMLSAELEPTNTMETQHVRCFAPLLSRVATR